MVALQSAPSYDRRSAMSLSSGHKLAHYEIIEPIGKGGMGACREVAVAK